MGFAPWNTASATIRLLLDIYFLIYEKGCQVQVSYYKRECIRVYLFRGTENVPAVFFSIQKRCCRIFLL